MIETILILATLAQGHRPRLTTPQEVKLNARITLAPAGGHEDAPGPPRAPPPLDRLYGKP